MASRLCIGFQRHRPRQPVAKLGTVLAEIAAAGLRPEPKPLVKIGSSTAMAFFDGARHLRHALVEMQSKQVLISGLCDLAV
ncbi:hypothetical protein SAMN05877831_11581 [Rhodobacter maris]|uniref:Uncharacterized protein n=1 Tax=Rhodobacter maris TaxID=446682 RepID=A0A285TC93_9RHOB|nr:hypothetical protein SAMN05877831_11581 [Rhodobacter maris]